MAKQIKERIGVSQLAAGGATGAAKVSLPAGGAKVEQPSGFCC